MKENVLRATKKQKHFVTFILLFCNFIESTSMRMTMNSSWDQTLLFKGHNFFQRDFHHELKRTEVHSSQFSPSSDYRDTSTNRYSSQSLELKVGKGFTNLFVLKIRKENSNDVLRNAESRGFRFLKKVFDDEDYYLLRRVTLCGQCRRKPRAVVLDFMKKSKSPTFDWSLGEEFQPIIYDLFQMCGHIGKNKLYVEQLIPQTPLKRVKRIHRMMFPEDTSTSNAILRVVNGIGKRGFQHFTNFTTHFNDPLYKDQWYLENRRQAGSRPPNDINVFPVWAAGIDGRGIRVSVLDDGVHGQNSELAANYDSTLSYDFINLKPQYPNSVAENSHGTYCAAVVAGVANNHRCGVGVAYGAKIGGPKIIDGMITDAQEAMSLVHALEFVDIYTASWGPKDDGRHVSGPGPLAQKAFVKGITKGRQGRGVIYVWAAGNGGHYYDNCNADGYASSIYTLTFGALTDSGLSTYYTEPCSSVIASSYVGGFHFIPREEERTKELHHMRVIVPEGKNKCKEDFQGTSAVAPMAAGAIALVLQANPSLSWRDVQHIVIESSRIPSADEAGWSLNGAGKHFHLKVGFGVMNVALMVAKAQTWKSVPPLKQRTYASFQGKSGIIFPGIVTTISLQVYENRMHFDKVQVLESVVATINITHPRFKDLDVFLESPAGTFSQIFSRRYLDNTTYEKCTWDFTSLHFWGESPFGEWKLHLSDKNPSSLKIGFISSFQLIVFGTSQKYDPRGRNKPEMNLKKDRLMQIMDKERQNYTINEMRKI